MRWHTEVRKITDLVGWKSNPRTIEKENFDNLMSSVDELGNFDPLVIDVDNTVIAGNQRLKVLTALKETEVEVSVPERKLTEEEIKKIGIISNRHSGEWDMDMLANEFEDILGELGFDDLLPEKVVEVEEDDYQEPEDLEVRVKTGEIWQLGNHRLMCGDSTKIEDVEKLMNGNKADMVFTDPPYGMNLDTDYTKMGDGGKKYNSVIADNEQFDASFLLGYFNYCRELFLWGADYYVETLHREYPSLGSWVVWDKYSDQERSGLLDGRFGSAFEMCWSKTPHKREVARVLVTTNYTARGDESRVHPTQKPVALSVWFLNRWGKEGGLIVDVFGGSGSTLIACEQTNRVCYMMELDEHYCTVILDRWEKLTGKQGIKIEG